MAEQNEWRFCTKCNSLFYNGYDAKGACAAGGSHTAMGYDFMLPYDVAPTASAQDGWRFCTGCQAMFYDGSPDQAPCPAGGNHAAAGFNFVLPHDVPGTPTAQTEWRFCGGCHAMFYDGYDDNGGVHINSGIPNRAFALAAIAIGGSSWEKAGQIWYAALTRRLTHTATFKEAATATISLAAEMYGTGKAEQIAVRDAWKAVGVTG